MAMDLNAKAAYIRGLMTGMEFDPASKNGKVIAAMMDLLEEMAATVTEHDNALDQVYDELETLDQDLDDLVMDLYGEDEEDGEEDEDLYEVTCPNCGAVGTRNWFAPTAVLPLTLNWKAPGKRRRTATGKRSNHDRES